MGNIEKRFKVTIAKYQPGIPIPNVHLYGLLAESYTLLEETHFFSVRITQQSVHHR
jgi:hypothetical protein